MAVTEKENIVNGPDFTPLSKFYFNNVLRNLTEIPFTASDIQNRIYELGWNIAHHGNYIEHHFESLKSDHPDRLFGHLRSKFIADFETSKYLEERVFNYTPPYASKLLKAFFVDTMRKYYPHTLLRKYVTDQNKEPRSLMKILSDISSTSEKNTLTYETYSQIIQMCMYEARKKDGALFVLSLPFVTQHSIPLSHVDSNIRPSKTLEDVTEFLETFSHQMLFIAANPDQPFHTETHELVKRMERTLDAQGQIIPAWFSGYFSTLHKDEGYKAYSLIRKWYTSPFSVNKILALHDKYFDEQPLFTKDCNVLLNSDEQYPDDMYETLDKVSEWSFEKESLLLVRKSDNEVFKGIHELVQHIKIDVFNNNYGEYDFQIAFKGKEGQTVLTGTLDVGGQLYVSLLDAEHLSDPKQNTIMRLVQLALKKNIDKHSPVKIHTTTKRIDTSRARARAAVSDQEHSQNDTSEPVINTSIECSDETMQKLIQQYASNAILVKLIKNKIPRLVEGKGKLHSFEPLGFVNVAPNRSMTYSLRINRKYRFLMEQNPHKDGVYTIFAVADHEQIDQGVL